MRPLPHRLRGILRQQATAHEQPQHAPAHLRLHLGDGVGIDPGRRMEGDPAGRRGREHAVDDHRVKVEVEAGRDRSDALPSPPCAGCCTKGRRRGPGTRMQSGSRGRTHRNRRGQNRGRGCRTPGSGGTRARRGRVPGQRRPRRRMRARSPSGSARCGRAGCAPAAAAGRAPCRGSPSCPHPVPWLPPAPAAAGVRSMVMGTGRTPLSAGPARSG